MEFSDKEIHRYTYDKLILSNYYAAKVKIVDDDCLRNCEPYNMDLSRGFCDIFDKAKTIDGYFILYLTIF
jgi:hypothetical protein